MPFRPLVPRLIAKAGLPLQLEIILCVAEFIITYMESLQLQLPAVTGGELTVFLCNRVRDAPSTAYRDKTLAIK